MKKFYISTIFLWLAFCPMPVNEISGKQAPCKSMEQAGALLDRFARKCERRTKKVTRRFKRFERKLMKSLTCDQPKTGTPTDLLSGNEPLLDSLRLVEGFRQYVAAPAAHNPSTVTASIDRAQQQLDIGRRTKEELMQRKEYWKAQAAVHPQCGRLVGKMEKERYYYTAQINEYRKVLRDPSLLDGWLTDAIRKDSRFNDYLAVLPAKPQDPAKMQPRQFVQQMMRNQANSIDAEPTQLIQETKKKGSNLLGELSEKATSIGVLDNAAQVPLFTPNPYKTKSFRERIDVGFDLQFDSRTRFYPASGVAGAQVSFNFDPKLSVGLSANYRFGMGEIKHVRFSHAGAGYGIFANYKVWKGLGLQAGYEHNWRAETEMNETLYATGWYSSALAGLTWEYDIKKRLKGSIGVLYDFLYKKHSPQSNAVLWRMGWKF
jgi:hypothetical protein